MTQIHTPGQPTAPYAPRPPYGYGPPPVPAPPRRRRTGLVVGLVIGLLVLVGGGTGALVLLGTRTLDTAEVEKQIAKLTEDRVGVAAADVSCPGDVAAETGRTFTCTASVDGQDVRYTVEETDDRGDVHIEAATRFVVVSTVVASVEQQVTERTGVEVTAECDTGGRKVVVDGIGKAIRCTVTNADDPTDTLEVTATVGEDGDVSISG